MAKSILGIDIGSKSIKAVELINNKQNFTLSSIGEIPFSNDVSNFLDTGSSEEISIYLKKLLSDIKVKNKNAVCSIPAVDTSVSIVNMPMMPEDELKYAMKWQLGKIVSGYPEEKDAFWDILSTGKEYSILVVGIEKFKLKKYMEIFSKSNIRLSSIEIDAVSLARVSVRGEESALIIHFGATQTTCVLVDSGVLSLVRYIKVGEDSLIDNLLKDGLSYEEAKNKLYEFGLLKFESKGKVYQKIAPLVDQVTAESKRIIGFYEEKNGKELKKVVLSGAGAYIPDMANHFIQEFSKDVTTVDPWVSIKCPSNIDSQNLVSVGPKFAVACGLAMSEL
ncbi:pilus assembly protein PilM [bacterium]|nr:pilus assembly protein PilM [bacterium]